MGVRGARRGVCRVVIHHERVLWHVFSPARRGRIYGGDGGAQRRIYGGGMGGGGGWGDGNDRTRGGCSQANKRTRKTRRGSRKTGADLGALRGLVTKVFFGLEKPGVDQRGGTCCSKGRPIFTIPKGRLRFLLGARGGNLIARARRWGRSWVRRTGFSKKITPSFRPPRRFFGRIWGGGGRDVATTGATLAHGGIAPGTQ